MQTFYKNMIRHSGKINWVLFLFLLLMLNVKLPVKITALLIILAWSFKSVSLKKIFSIRPLYFYFSMVLIALINYAVIYKTTEKNYSYALLLGIGLWLVAAASCYFLYEIIKTESQQKLHDTITLFFALHIGMTFLELFLVMVETGSINPYTYTGLNQKYYISTGDAISGITFDNSITTGLISAFAGFYFLYRKYYLLSLVATFSLSIMGSNLLNIFFTATLLLIFILRTNRIQKSFILIHLCILALFITKISPQNNEYTGRIFYKLLGKTYDLPKKNEDPDYIKTLPDSTLDAAGLRKKTAKLYLDSISALTYPEKETKTAIVKKDTTHRQFYAFKEPATITQQKDKYSHFIEQHYTNDERKEMDKQYDWNKPGKWIALLQFIHFFKKHPGKIILGTGTGNLSSRLAFKTTGLSIAGNYPARFTYIHPWFLYNHLYLYLAYHTQDQAKHAAANIPNSTYVQLLGEYGIAGFLSFIVVYLWYFAKRLSRLSFGLPVMLLLLSAFFVDYWFEQLSIVILFEFLLFLDIKENKSIPISTVPGT